MEEDIKTLLKQYIENLIKKGYYTREKRIKKFNEDGILISLTVEEEKIALTPQDIIKILQSSNEFTDDVLLELLK